MTYNPGQIEHAVKFITGVPEWFILGGPANGNEAQCAQLLWPNVKILGIEPFYLARNWQLGHGWPAKAPLLLAALWSEVGEMPLLTQPESAALRLAQSRLAEPGTDAPMVSTTTLDALDQEYGPFENAFAWLDIEGAEFAALTGAAGLFSRKAFLALNIEIDRRKPDNADRIHFLMGGYGYRQAGFWQLSNPDYEDRVYVRG